MNEMEAVVYARYGGPEVLEIAEVPRPTPKKGEVLVRVSCASINAADYRMMRADPFLARLSGGLFAPKKKILGVDVAGIVEAIGPGVTTLAVGDAVFGDTFLDGLGGFAEYVCVREGVLAKKPERTSFEEAAAVPLASITALQAVRDRAKVSPGQSVLIQGAGGGVGMFLVQIAKAAGAAVTAVCGPSSVDVVRSLGADDVIDYTQEDFTTRTERYDAIFGVNGYHALGAYKAHLKSGGTYVMIGGTNRQLFEALLLGSLYSVGGDKRFVVFTIDDSLRAGDIEEVRALLAAGKLKPTIDRVFPLAQTADAMRYVEQGHVRGKVILKMRGAVVA